MESFQTLRKTLVMLLLGVWKGVGEKIVRLGVYNIGN